MLHLHSTSEANAPILAELHTNEKLTEKLLDSLGEGIFGINFGEYRVSLNRDDKGTVVATIWENRKKVTAFVLKKVPLNFTTCHVPAIGGIAQPSYESPSLEKIWECSMQNPQETFSRRGLGLGDIPSDFLHSGPLGAIKAKILQPQLFSEGIRIIEPFIR